MKILKRLFLLLTVLIFGMFIAGFLYYEWVKPVYRGPKKLSGLTEKVNVYFDKFGVPHIYANTDEDAFRTLGYLQAQDRLWQMELVRRIAPGRLSEIFGADLLETDRFFRTLGMHQYSETSAANLQKSSPKVYALAQAYLDGINYFIEEGSTPVEYLLVGAEKTPFTLVDVYNVIGYMSFSFAAAHKTEPVVEYIQQLGDAYMQALPTDVSANTTILKSDGIDASSVKMVSGINRIFDKLPVAPFIGSNSWVVSPAKSASGAAVLCNDPHIAFSQPAVWYEARLVSPSFDFYGYHLVGNPFANLTHSEYTATGLTMFENDDLDFYREKINPENENEYWVIDHWEAFNIRQETIIVKDGANEVIEVKSSRHGPIMNTVIDPLKKEQPIAAWWTYFEFPNKLLEATFQMSTAKNMAEMKEAAKIVHAPGLNVMYADKEGNIAWWAAAKLVKRPPHVNPKAILDGASGADDPIGYYDFSENPQSVNPASGYVYSANNQSEMNIPDSAILYPGYYLPEDRAKRIVEVMESKEKFDRADLKALFLDSKNTNIAAEVSNLAAVMEGVELTEKEAEVLRLFRAWDGNHEADTQGAQVFYVWAVYAMEYAMMDELASLDAESAQEIFDSFMQTHWMKRSLLPFLLMEENPWWDDLNTEEKETREDILRKSFKQAVAHLYETYGDQVMEMAWKDFHTVEHGHALGQVEALRKYFNVGPYGVSGAENVLNNMGFTMLKDKLFKVTYGPSTRRIIDFADINTSESILPTGNSGNLFSEHYRDQAEMYHRGEWRKMVFDKQEIMENMKDKMIFRPGK